MTAGSSAQHPGDQVQDRAKCARQRGLAGGADVFFGEAVLEHVGFDQQHPVGEVAAEVAADGDGGQRDDPLEREHHDVLVGVQGPLQDRVPGDALAQGVRQPVRDLGDVVEAERPGGAGEDRPFALVGGRLAVGGGLRVDQGEQAADQVRLGGALLALDQQDRVRDAGQVGGDDPADREPVVIVGQVDQGPQRIQRAAALRFRQGVGQLGPAEDHRGLRLDRPAAGADPDALAGLGAHVDQHGVLMAADPQPDRLRVELGGLAFQHGDGVGQRGGGGDLAGAPPQRGREPGPQAVAAAGGQRHGDARAEPGHRVGAAVGGADQPVGILGHLRQHLGLPARLRLVGHRVGGQRRAVGEELLVAVASVHLQPP